MPCRPQGSLSMPVSAFDCAPALRRAPLRMLPFTGATRLPRCRLPRRVHRAVNNEAALLCLPMQGQ
jgi:hypothetical protein